MTGIDNKTKKNASDILVLENKLTQEGDTMNENERELSIFRGFFFYLQKNHLVYDCKVGSFFLIIKKYQSGSQQAFLIVQIIMV